MIGAFEKRIEELEANKLRLEDKLLQKAAPRATMDEVFEPAIQFLATPYEIYKKGSFALKRLVLRSAFPSPVTYTKEQGVRAAQVYEIYTFIGACAQECEMVRSHRISSNTKIQDSDGSVSGDFSVSVLGDEADLDVVFDELERLETVLRPHVDEIRKLAP